ncbi:bidirectional sugar transporter SWEET6b-like [Cornus florida]|uniref:bidirectional sugar transporter SWEET6b-like n=1 Tax=Cornus florida TaxID=4283 RepID=UPI00289B1204|nr:bidirectional sugar transporter SWEET6b-like [Cornus florida]
MNARDILGIAGSIISLFLITFRRICNNKDVEQFSCVPYVATALNCSCWIIYARVSDPSHNIALLCISCIGLVVELVYVYLYWLYANGERVNQRTTVIAYVGGCVALLAIFGIITLVWPKNKKREKEVIETRSTQYMPIHITLLSLLNGIFWLAYALVKFELFLVLGTGAGLLCGAVQLFLYLKYREPVAKIEQESASLLCMRLENFEMVQEVLDALGCYKVLYSTLLFCCLSIASIAELMFDNAVGEISH